MQKLKCKNQNYISKFKIFKFWILALIFNIWVLNFLGCATAPYTMPPLTSGMTGIYHRIEKGQTLWRISKIHNVELDEIARINRIFDASRIEVGQLIFIPQKSKPLPPSPASYPEDFIWPIKGKIIASFGQTFNDMINKGINIQPYKSSDVLAARSGRVIFYADNFAGFGKTIIIDHGDGFSTVYTNSSQIFVKLGEVVNKGMLIAKLSLTEGNKNTYLHFEVRKTHIPQNPYFYLPH